MGIISKVRDLKILAIVRKIFHRETSMNLTIFLAKRVAKSDFSIRPQNNLLEGILSELETRQKEVN